MFEHISKELTDIRKEVKFTNGKVKDLMAWREQVKGASTALKSVWAIIGIFIIGMTIALFNMWVEFQSLDLKIETAVADEVSEYQFFEEVE